MTQDATVNQYPVLNPNAPLRFLDPETAFEFTLGHYVIVGSLAVGTLPMLAGSELTSHRRS